MPWLRHSASRRRAHYYPLRLPAAARAGAGGRAAGPGAGGRAAPSAVAGSAACRASCALCAELGLLIRIETCSSMYRGVLTVHAVYLSADPPRRAPPRTPRARAAISGGAIPDLDRHLQEEESTLSLSAFGRSECSNPAAAMCTSIAWFHGDCGDDRGDATPSRDALDGASVGSQGAPRVSLRQACAARGESGVSCGVWSLRLGLGGRSMRR